MMGVTTSVTASDARPARASDGRGYWGHVWAQLRRNRPGVFGLAVIALIVVTALLAPLLANDRPLVARLHGDMKFPAFASYVDSWVPWQSLRNELKSLKVAGTFPFSDAEPDLGGRTWKEARAEGLLSLDAWPPIPYHPLTPDRDARKLLPSWSSGHLLGTDDLGRDVLARLVHGTVVALLVGIISTSIAFAIGVTLGLVAGYFGGTTDLVLSRFTEIVIVFPTFFLIIAVIAFLEPSVVNVMLVLGLVGWTGIFRILRGEVLKVRALDYVTAAEALGSRSPRLLFRHVLPNAIPPVFVSVAFGVASAVLAEAGLSFLGFGDPNVSSWGEIVNQGRYYVNEGLWHLTMFPGLAIFLTLTAFNLFGQGLRDAMDPKLRR